MLVFALGAALLGFRAPALAESAPGSACTHVAEIAAMQIDDSAPVIIGRDGELERFGQLVVDSYQKAPPSPLVSSRPPTITCTGIHGVVGLAVGWRLEPTYVATYDEVFIIPHGSNAIAGAFRPTLAPGESIRAIALTPYSTGIEIAVGHDSDAERPGRSRTRFFVYSPKARGAAKPVRTFMCSTLRGDVDAISIDSSGLTYAATEGGQIAIFAAKATGDASPAELLDGFASGLRPSPATGPRRPRPLAFDYGGELFAAYDDVIVRFRFKSEDKTHIVPGIPSMSGRRDGLGLVQALATDDDGLVYAVSVDPDTGTKSLVIFRGFLVPPGERHFLTSMPL